MQSYLLRALAGERARLPEQVHVSRAPTAGRPADILRLPRATRLRLVRLAEAGAVARRTASRELARATHRAQRAWPRSAGDRSRRGAPRPADPAEPVEVRATSRRSSCRRRRRRRSPAAPSDAHPCHRAPRRRCRTPARARRRQHVGRAAAAGRADRRESGAGTQPRQRLRHRRRRRQLRRSLRSAPDARRTSDQPAAVPPPAPAGARRRATPPRRAGSRPVRLSPAPADAAPRRAIAMQIDRRAPTARGAWSRRRRPPAVRGAAGAAAGPCPARTGLALQSAASSSRSARRRPRRRCRRALRAARRASRRPCARRAPSSLRFGLGVT